MYVVHFGCVACTSAVWRALRLRGVRFGCVRSQLLSAQSAAECRVGCDVIAVGPEGEVGRARYRSADRSPTSAAERALSAVWRAKSAAECTVGCVRVRSLAVRGIIRLLRQQYRYRGTL